MPDTRNNRRNRAKIATLQRRLDYLAKSADAKHGHTGAEIAALSWAIEICLHIIAEAKEDRHN